MFSAYDAINFTDINSTTIITNSEIAHNRGMWSYFIHNQPILLVTAVHQGVGYTKYINITKVIFRIKAMYKQVDKFLAVVDM